MHQQADTAARESICIAVQKRERNTIRYEADRVALCADTHRNRFSEFDLKGLCASILVSSSRTRTICICPSRVTRAP